MCPLTAPFQVLVNAIRQEKERQGMQTGMEETKLPLFTDDMIAYIENPKQSNTNPGPRFQYPVVRCEEVSRRE